MSTPPEAMLGGLAVATMFRGDPRQLVQWCNFHLNAGADRLYVVLDRPGETLAASVPDDPRLVVVPIEQATWSRFYAANADNVERKQVDAFRWLARRAEAEGHTHLAFIDTDELIDLGVPFEDVVAEHPRASALTLRTREMWYADGGHTGEPFGATLALRWQPGGLWNDVFGWRAQYFRNGVLGHDAGKTIYRLPMAAGSISVHGPLDGVLRSASVVLPEESGRLLHFDSGSVATWNHKWASRLTGGAVARGLGPHRRAQLRLFTPELRRSPAEQRRFFERFFSLDQSAVERLESAGLIDRVEIGSSLDQPLRVPAPTDDQIVQVPGTPERVDYQFAMVCDRNFVKPTFATLVSVLAQIDPARSVRFVVLGDGLAESDVRYFKALERSAYHLEVQVHDVTPDLDRDVGQDLHKRSRATYGRVYLVDLLPEQRTVYLDGDVLATRDISELFSLDLGDACLAGVPDSAALRIVADPAGVPMEQRMRIAGIAGPDPREYLNAGVLVLDLDHPDFRELALRSRAHVAMEGRALAQHDQDAINLAFRGRKHRLPSTYNYMTQFYTSERALDGDLIALKYEAADASLIHFSGKIKPWIATEDEFYNALYRKIVSAAEDRVGVSCGFFFSTRAPADHADWTAQRWVDELCAGAAETVPELSTRYADVELVDLADDACYLRFSADAYEHAARAGLHVVARTAAEHGAAVLFDIPVATFGPPLVHLLRRVGPGVRSAAVDLRAALRPFGGVVRHVEVVLAAPASAEDPGGVPSSPTRFERSLTVLQVLATEEAATPDLLADLAIDGKLDGLVDGFLEGWYHAAGEEPMVLRIGSRPVSVRREPKVEDDGSRVIRFRARALVAEGYGSSGEAISVRVAGTNVPVPGPSLTVDDVRREGRKPARPAPGDPAAPGRPVLRRVVGKVRRQLRRS